MSADNSALMIREEWSEDVIQYFLLYQSATCLETVQSAVWTSDLFFILGFQLQTQQLLYTHTHVKTLLRQ